MIDYMKKTYRGILKLVLANWVIVFIGYMLFVLLYEADFEDAIGELAAIYDMALFLGLMFYVVLWCALSLLPCLIGYWLCRKSEAKVNLFLGLVTVTFVMLGILDVYFGYLIISLMVAGINVWFCLIPLGVSVFMLIKTMINVYSGYKKLFAAAYVGANMYPQNFNPGNAYNYGYNNVNYYPGYVLNPTSTGYQSGQQFDNHNY